MRKKIHVIPVICFLILALFMAGKQLIAAFYHRMGGQDRQQLNKTIEYLEKGIALDGKNALFHFSLGKAFLRKGLAETTKLRERNKWIRRSIDEFYKAAKLEPSNSDYHFHLGIGYGCLTYPSPFYWNAIQNSFKRTVMLNPSNIHHLYSIATYYLNEYQRLKNIGLNTEGISSVNHQKYLTTSQNNYQLYFRKLLDVNKEYLAKILRKCFLITRKYDDLKDIIRNSPSDHALLARFLNNKGMWGEAQNEFLRAINLEPDNQEHYSHFAHALFRRGFYKDAIYWWQKQKALDPGDDEPYLCSADSFMKLRRFDASLKELRDLIALHPENMNYQIKLVRTLMAAGHLDEAIGEYRNIMEKDPNFSKEKYDSIRYYRRIGNYRKATEVLNKALSSFFKR